MDSDALPLSRSAVDADARRRSEPFAQILQHPRVRVLQVRDGSVVGTEVGLAFADAPEQGHLLAYLGVDEEDWRYIAQLEPLQPQPQPQEVNADAVQARPQDDAQHRVNIRNLGFRLSPRDAGLAATALALAAWHGRNPFCSACGTRTTPQLAGWERSCDGCGCTHYPRTDAAVIMAITDAEDRLLLGHAPGWPDAQYSVPAGFVEPGESLESAVRREVAEETAIIVGDVAYAGSQPWPFPASLMLGFTGTALTTEPDPDGVELVDAMFVSRGQLRAAIEQERIRLPRPTSIAHHLIAEWYGQELPLAQWSPGPPSS